MDIDVRDERFHLLAERCLYWPSRRWLVVADCHLGKAETFQRRGRWLPSGAGRTDLETLTRVCMNLDPRTVVFLGDLVHAVSGVTGLVREEFAGWLGGFKGDVWVVVGNHDARLATHWPEQWRTVKLCERIVCGGFVFQHEPVKSPEVDGRFCWVGHLHPMIRLQRGPDRLRLPGFVVSRFQGFLPAFSSASGGYDMSLNMDDRAFVIGEGTVYEV